MLTVPNTKTDSAGIYGGFFNLGQYLSSSAIPSNTYTAEADVLQYLSNTSHSMAPFGKYSSVKKNLLALQSSRFIKRLVSFEGTLTC